MSDDFEPSTTAERQPPDKGIPGSRRGMSAWQERLLPLMTGLLIGLTVFFFAASFGQLIYLHWNIARTPQVDLAPAPEADPAGLALSFEQLMQARRLDLESRLEANLIERRYHIASVAMMSGLWVRYLGFVTGMILALVGASFVLGKLREPITSLEGKFSEIGISLRSTSPGIILVVLGVVLMFATIVDEDISSVTDAPVYFNSSTITSIEMTPDLPAQVPGLLPTRVKSNPTEAASTQTPRSSSP